MKSSSDKNLLARAKKVVPPALRRQMRELPLRLGARRTRRRFATAASEPAWLGSEDLEALARAGEEPPTYGYDRDSLRQRGEKRAAELLSLGVVEAARPRTFLELGSWDGMVCVALRQAGLEATATDLTADGFDPRLAESGIPCLAMDAADLKFPDASFDFVFSYDALEHFPYPDRVLAEALRVLKPGGHVFFVSGPLYLSPYGLHAYRSVPVLYAQCLFPEDLILEFARRRNPKASFPYVNRWPVTRYRQVWREYGDRFDVVFYREQKNYEQHRLIARYPSCFRSKTDCFDDLVVQSIKVLFQKRL